LRGVQATTMEVRPAEVALGASPNWESDAIPVANRAQVAALIQLLFKLQKP
jgi:hypothetical protein